MEPKKKQKHAGGLRGEQSGKAYKSRLGLRTDEEHADDDVEQEESEEEEPLEEEEEEIAEEAVDVRRNVVKPSADRPSASTSTSIGGTGSSNGAPPGGPLGPPASSNDKKKGKRGEAYEKCEKCLKTFNGEDGCSCSHPPSQPFRQHGCIAAVVAHATGHAETCTSMVPDVVCRTLLQCDSPCKSGPIVTAKVKLQITHVVCKVAAYVVARLLAVTPLPWSSYSAWHVTPSVVCWSC
jgi:hypothetical protein